MVDPRDLGLVTQVRSPHAEEPTIYLYEAVPGGIGLSERLWQRHDELLAGAADLITSCPATAARRARGRGWSRTSTPSDSRCGCWPSSASPPAPGSRRRDDGPVRRLYDGGGRPAGSRATARARQGRARSPIRCPTGPSPAGISPGGWRRRSAVTSSTARPGSMSGSRRTPSTSRSTGFVSGHSPAAGRATPCLPRHRDDRPRDGGRHARLPDRPRLVVEGDLPPGPAVAAGPG